MADLEALSQHLLSQPLNLLSLERELADTVVRARADQRERIQRALTMKARMDAEPNPTASSVLQQQVFEVCLEQLQTGLSALSTDLQFAIVFETRAELVQRLAAVAGPVVRMSDLSQLLQLARDSDEATQVRNLVRNLVKDRAAGLLADGLPAQTPERASLPDDTRDDDARLEEWLRTRASLVDRVMLALGMS
jgi:hypothetical protein